MKKYYNSLIYQMRVIFENYVFNPANLASRKEKERLFEEVINKPDYAKAIEVCEADCLLKDDRIYLEFAKQRSPVKIRRQKKRQACKRNIR